MEGFDCSFFSRSEWISRDDDVTMVFALNEIAAAILIFSGNALRFVNFGCLPSAVQSCTKISVEFRHIVEFLFKGFNFCVNWILDLIQSQLNPNPLEFKGLLARSSTASSVSENEYILPEEFIGKMALTIKQGFALPKKELAIFDGDPLEYLLYTST